MSETTDLLREQFDYIQAHIEILDSTDAACTRKGFSLNKALIREGLKELRLCVTTPRKHYPKAPDIYRQLPPQGVKKIIIDAKLALDSNSPLDIEALRQLHGFLVYHKTYHDSWEDMYGKAAVKIDSFRAYYLSKKQLERDSWLHNVHVDEGRVGRMHAKYVKAFKEDPTLDFRDWIDQYITANGWEADD